MALGAMQPYLFPYLGYFQLMDCTDIYIFCGNLQYIKRGWINRNKVFTNFKEGEIQYFTFSVANDDYKKTINQRYYSNLKRDCNKLKENIFHNYRRALNFEEAYSLIEEIVEFSNDNVAYFNMNANYKIAKYLGITTRIICTDVIDDNAFWENFNQLDYEKRAIYICQYFSECSYINAINGMALYHRDVFAAEGIDLKFIKMDKIEYAQFSNPFVPNLSILDVIMHNKVQDVKKMLKRYQLI